MPAKKTTVVTSRTIKARLSDTAMLGKLEKLKADKGWNDSDLLREALKEYLERERLRDDLATMDKRFGSTLKRLAQKQNVMRSEMAVLVAFTAETSRMPAKKTTVVTSRTIKARLSDTAMLGKLEKLKADKGWNDSDLLREALKEYLERERLRDDLATMDKRFGSALKRLAQKQNVMRSEMAVLVAFMGCATSKVPFVAPGAVVGQAAIVTVEPVCKNGGLSKDGVVSITEIDGLRTSPSAFGKPNPVAYVAAGEHKFSVEHALGHGAFHAQLRLHAEAATSYLLHCEGSWRERFWFTEASTGRVVGGLVDP